MMRLSDKKIKNHLQAGITLPCSRQKIDETVRSSKAAFCANQEEGTLSNMEFLYQQSKYIHKRWWLVQGALLAALWRILNSTDSGYYIQRILGIAAPLFVILIMPEFWKNKNSCSVEIECTAYYSLRQIYTARLILFALTDLMLLSLFLAAVSLTGKMTAADMMIQFLIPFNVSCCICFRTLYGRAASSESFAVLLCIVWTAVWTLIVLNEKIYSTISFPAWGVLFAVSVLYMGYCISRLRIKWEETWEVKPLWS